MPTLSSVSYEDLLRSLSVRINNLQKVLDAQPVFATHLAAVLRQELGNLLSGQAINPDAVFLNEYVSEPASNALRITRSRTLTQVAQEAIVTGTSLSSDTRVESTGRAKGFYHSASGAGQDGTITALDVDVFGALLDRLRQNSLTMYQRKLDEFWSSPHPLTGDLSVHEAVSQQQSEILRFEADLHRAAAKKKNAAADLRLLNEGRQMIENLLLHEASGAATPPLAVTITLKDRDTPEWSVPINGAFVLSERLHTGRPAVLYTAQYGLEIFESFSVMGNTLSLRLVSEPHKSRLLATVPASERTRASQVLRSQQNLGYVTITGSLFSHCLHRWRTQQSVDIAKAFSVTHATFDALTATLNAALALPLSGSPSLTSALPAPPDPLVQPAVFTTPPDSEQQIHLIRLWDSLNAQVGDVLDKRKHPSLDGALSALLKQTFTQLPVGVSSDALYVNSYRTDDSDVRHLESSQTLREAVYRLLPWGYLEDEEAEQADSAVFHSPTTVAETDQIMWSGTLQGLAEDLQVLLPAQVTEYWRTPLAAGLPCPQVKLNELYHQCLGIQARLLFADNTLSPAAKLLIDRVLRYTTQARREAHFIHGQRPGVYQLTVGSLSPQGERLAASLVLTSCDGSAPHAPHWPRGHKNLSGDGVGGSMVPGPVVLYTPYQGFEEFPSLQELYAALTARIDAGEEAGRLLGSSLPVIGGQELAGLWGSSLHNVFRPIEGDFVADSVQSLLNKQIDDIQSLLGHPDGWRDEDLKVVCGVPDVERNGRAELVELLDMASAFVARNQLLLKKHLPAWEKGLSAADKTRLQTLERAVLDKQQALATLWTVIPSLVDYARQQVLFKLQGLAALKAVADKAQPCRPAPQVDPDRTVVTLTERVRIVAGGGFGSSHESVEAQTMSLTQLLLRNTRPWEKGLSWTSGQTLKANLADSTGKWLCDSSAKPIVLSADVLEQWLKELNVGPNYIETVLRKNLSPDPMTSQAQALKDAWKAALAANLSYAALAAELNPDAYSASRDNNAGQKKCAAWVAAVLAAPLPQHRQKVDKQAVSANALMFNPANNAPEGRGGQTVNGVLMIATAVDESVVLYAPDAPDGQLLREIKNEATLAELFRNQAWQAYISARLPANTRLLNPRLAPHTGNFLDGLYRQHYLHLIKQADEQTVSNEELEYQSSFNKVMFGIEVGLTAFGGIPGTSTYVSAALKWIMRVGGTTLQSLRNLGRSIPALIVRRGLGGRAMVEMATASAHLDGAVRMASMSLRPLPLVLRPGASSTRSMAPSLVTGYQRAFQRQSAALAVRGGIPAGSSLSQGTGIYRAPGSPTTLLVRCTQESGEGVLLRIQDSFNLYDPNGLVVRVLTPSGATTPFRLRLMSGTRQWVLDTFERMPGGAPNRSLTIENALKEWQEILAQTPGQTPAITPAEFFGRRGINDGTWAKFVKRSGQFSVRGAERVAGMGSKHLTDDVFMQWANTPNKSPQNASVFREGRTIALEHWHIYVAKDGSLTERGLARQIKILNLQATGRTHRKITDDHLKAWYQLSLDPANRNKHAVGKFAIEHNIHLTTWQGYVRSNGSFWTNRSIAARLRRLGIPVDSFSVAGPSTAPT